MAKDLPYFKFMVSEWNDGDITLCSLEAQGLFVNLCALYWSQEGDLSITKAKRRYNHCNTTVWDELIVDRIIKIDGDHIVINFLDEQFSDRDKLSNQNKKNIEKRWNKEVIDTTVIPSNNGRTVPVYNKEKRREEEKREEENMDKVFFDDTIKPSIIIKDGLIGLRMNMLETYILGRYGEQNVEVLQMQNGCKPPYDSFLKEKAGNIYPNPEYFWNSFKKFWRDGGSPGKKISKNPGKL